MWQSSTLHHRPSRTVESSSVPLPSRYPNRALRSRNGAWFIDSMPPATYTSPSPARIAAAANMIDLRPEPQTRLIVVAGVVSASPARSSAWRAGAWPAPACSTWPMMTSSIGRVRWQAGSVDGRADGDGAELDRGDAREPPAELPDRRPGGADDVDVTVRPGRRLHGGQSTPGRPRGRRPALSAGRSGTRGPSSVRGGPPRRARGGSRAARTAAARARPRAPRGCRGRRRAR